MFLGFSASSYLFSVFIIVMLLVFNRLTTLFGATQLCIMHSYGHTKCEP